jgi:transcriptional regulator with XRE-family HTH domain
MLKQKPRHFIREWRKHRGLTQEQLAERIGIGRSYLTKIERGDRRWDQPFLEAAADALRCEPQDILVRDPTDPEGIWSIWDRINKMKPHDRLKVVAIMDAMGLTGTDN